MGARQLLAWLVLVAVMAGCSGGGRPGGSDGAAGGGVDGGAEVAADLGGGTPPADAGNPGAVDAGPVGGAAYSLSQGSLTFRARGGGLRPAPQSIEITAHVSPLYLEAEVGGNALESATVVVTGERTARLEVRAASPNVLPVGTAAASVYIRGCNDPLCGSNAVDGARTVPVTYIREPGGVSGDPAMLTFTQPFGGPAPAPQTVALRDLGEPPLPYTSRLNPESASSWLTVRPAAGALPGTVTIGVVPPARAGSYNATVQFLSDATAGFGVTVSYTISADFRVTPAAINVVGAFGAATADQRISLSDALGLSYPWTVTVAFMDGTGWLGLSPASGGTLPAEVTVSLGALPDRFTRQALLRFTGAGIDRMVQLTYRTP
jgi:hypothetical protein